MKHCKERQQHNEGSGFRCAKQRYVHALGEGHLATQLWADAHVTHGLVECAVDEALHAAKNNKRTKMMITSPVCMRCSKKRIVGRPLEGKHTNLQGPSPPWGIISTTAEGAGQSLTCARVPPNSVMGMEKNSL
jgi:hypothetical protein